MALCPVPATPWEEEHQLWDQLHLSSGIRFNKIKHLETLWLLYNWLVESWGPDTCICSLFSVVLALLPLACWRVGQRLLLLHWSQIIPHTWEATEQESSWLSDGLGSGGTREWVLHKSLLDIGTHSNSQWSILSHMTRKDGVSDPSHFLRVRLNSWSSYHHESTECSKPKRDPLVPMLSEGLLPEIAQLFCAPLLLLIYSSSFEFMFIQVLDSFIWENSSHQVGMCCWVTQKFVKSLLTEIVASQLGWIYVRICNLAFSWEMSHTAKSCSLAELL